MGNDAGESQTLDAGEVDRVIDWLMLESTIAKSLAGKALISTQILVFSKPDNRFAVQAFDCSTRLFDNRQPLRFFGQTRLIGEVCDCWQLFSQSPLLLKRQS